MPISASDCLFVHIPKCAGTSIEVALGVADEYPDIGLKPTSTRPNLDTLFGGGLQHLTAREIRRHYPELLGRERLFYFSVLRDPVERFAAHISWKFSLVSSSEPSDEGLRDYVAGQLRQLEDFAGGLEVFGDPFAGMEYRQADPQTVEINAIDRHLLPQCSFVFDDGRLAPQRLYTTGNIDGLEADLNALGRLARPIERRMTSPLSRRMRAALPEAAAELIRTVYRHDQALYSRVAQLERATGRSPQSRDIDAEALGRQSVDLAPRAGQGRTSEEPLPRHLWIYWHQGWRNAPTLVRRCAETWAAQNPDWEVHLLDKDRLGDFIAWPGYAGDADMPLPTLSDIIRIHLLAAHGGVWVDATTWCMRPLSEWIDRAAGDIGFFGYSNPAPGRLISSWFLAASRGNYIVDCWKRATDGYMQPGEAAGRLPSSDNPFTENYFWFHTLFGELVEQDTRVGEAWARRVDVSADAPHFLQFEGLLNPASPGVLFHIRNVISNVYKLSRRIELPEDLEGTVLGALFASAAAPPAQADLASVHSA